MARHAFWVPRCPVYWPAVTRQWRRSGELRALAFCEYESLFEREFWTGLCRELCWESLQTVLSVTPAGVIDPRMLDRVAGLAHAWPPHAGRAVPHVEVRWQQAAQIPRESAGSYEVDRDARAHNLAYGGRGKGWIALSGPRGQAHYRVSRRGSRILLASADSSGSEESSTQSAMVGAYRDDEYDRPQSALTLFHRALGAMIRFTSERGIRSRSRMGEGYLCGCVSVW